MPRSYANNSSNRSLGRVGMPVGSMVVSSGSRSSSASASFGSSGSVRSYVDNTQNRQLGRVGMSVGSMPVSNPGNSSSVSTSKTYVDNAYNQKIGRVGKEHGTMVVSKNPSYEESKSKSSIHSSEKTYVDNDYNRRLQRVGVEHGTMVVSKSSSRYSSSSSDPNAERKDVEKIRFYKDNAFNRRLERVGKPIGTAVHSKRTREYQNKQDFGANYSEEASYPSYPEAFQRPTYGDNSLNRSFDRVGREFRAQPGTCNKQTEWIHKVYQRFRENPDGDVPHDLPALPEEMEDASVDKINDLMNRLKFERKWRQQSKSKSVPRTENALLRYKGPMIEYSDLKLGNVIGRGAFGVVYHAKYDELIVAVKKLHVTRVSRRRQQAFAQEVDILSKLDHEFIVKFIGACTTTPNLCIVMEYMQMSLYDALHVDRGGLDDFTDEDRLAMILQTILGLEYLHSKNVAHCDIKTVNILIDHDGTKFTVAKLSDFGLSQMKNETETSLSSRNEAVRVAGTPRYSAPEIHRGELLNLEQMKMSDMYSYGLVVFEIVFEEEPFANLNAAQLRKQVGENGQQPQFPTTVKPDNNLHRLLLSCWDINPNRRPTAWIFYRAVNELSCIYENLYG